MSNATTVLLCGVGGQGTILAADLLARTALASNYDVKVSEIHGMSQREGGYLLVADEDIKPLPVLTGKAGMPENAREKLQAAGASLIPAGPIAEQVATSKSVNVVLLGALATRLDFSEEVWKEVISKRVPPKTVEANLRAFDAGYEFARKGAE